MNIYGLIEEQIMGDTSNKKFNSDKKELKTSILLIVFNNYNNMFILERATIFQMRRMPKMSLNQLN